MVQVHTGPIQCFWCRSEIPYTIRDTCWYWFICGRYTLKDKVGEYAGDDRHSCILVLKETLIYNVSLECTLPFCTKDPIVKSPDEYESGLKLKGERDYVHSKEWLIENDHFRPSRPVRSPTVTMEEIEMDPARMKQWERFNRRSSK